MCRKTGSDCRKWVPLFSPLPCLASSQHCPQAGPVAQQPLVGIRPAPSLEPVGSWTHDLAGQPESYHSCLGSGQDPAPTHMQAGQQRPRHCREVTPSAIAFRALQAWWAPRGQEWASPPLLLPCQWRSWPLPYSSLPHTLSRCPGSQWGSQRPAWSPPSSPGTVAYGPVVVAGCWRQGLTRANQRYGWEGSQGVRLGLCHIQGHLLHCHG